jgi:hypothetical protein
MTLGAIGLKQGCTIGLGHGNRRKKLSYAPKKYDQKTFDMAFFQCTVFFRDHFTDYQIFIDELSGIHIYIWPQK